MEKLYKPSSYNIQTTSQDGKYTLIFNTFTGALIQVPKSLNESLSLYLSDRLNHTPLKSTRISNVLMRAGCIVEYEKDELTDLKELYMKNTQRQTMHISIMPTLECNMECIYCFEKHRNISMNKQKAIVLLKFLEKNLAGKSHLILDWYGGEPLLKKEFILWMQPKIINLCNSLGINSSFSMTTNGVLLTPDLCDRLVSEGVKSFQVTIDGPKQIHDRRRPHKNGSSSFDKIVSNITYAMRNTNIMLRVNIDRMNITYIGDLLDELKATGLDKVKQISFKAVVLAGGIDLENRTFSIPEFAEVIQPEITKANQLGFNVYTESQNVSEFCPVDLSNQWIIDPDLYLYKCTDAVDPSCDSVGKINLDGQMQLNNYFNIWRNKTIFEDETCKKCVYLPQCMGGCALKKLIHKKDWCPEERFALSAYIQHLYQQFESK